MWLIYRKSFRKHLSSVLGYDEKKSGTIMRSAGKKYREIIDQMPEFERADRFKMNAVNCALFISFLSCMDRKPSLETATRFYTKAMMTPVTKWFCRMSEAGGASVFTREHTIASGWEYCDNGYKKRQRDAGQCRDKEQTNKAVI